MERSGLLVGVALALAGAGDAAEDGDEAKNRTLFERINSLPDTSKVEVWRGDCCHLSDKDNAFTTWNCLIAVIGA